MGIPFQQTLDALHRDGPSRRAPAAGCGCLMLGAWMLWLIAAPLALTVTASQARIETEASVGRATSAVVGRVLQVAVEVGDPVEAGDVLVSLNPAEHDLLLQEELAVATALAGQADALAEQLAALDEVIAALEAGSGADVASARADWRAAQSAAQRHHQAAETARGLAASGSIAASELWESESRESQSSEVAASARHAVATRGIGTRIELGEARSLRAAVAAEAAEISGRFAAVSASVERRELAVEERTIRAAIDGRVAELADLAPGARVDVGQILATIVPDDALRVVAQFPPGRAAGRLAEGQPAVLRLDAFPWTEHGVVRGRVTSVAEEPRGDLLRVELQITSAPDHLTLSHGMSGEASVRTGWTAPLGLAIGTLARRIHTETP